MERIDGVLGNVREDETLATARASHEAAGTLERLVVDETDRRRSRLRAETDAGTDLGVLVDRPLAPGDVLACGDDRMIVVRLEAREALAVDLPEPTPAAMARAVELGHAVGNHHWECAVVGETAYVPLEADRHIVERTIGAVLPEAACRVESVDAELFLAEGGDGRAAHEHGRDPDRADDIHSQGHGGAHSHEHGGVHEHSHDEAHGHSHDAHGHEHLHADDEADRRDG